MSDSDAPIEEFRRLFRAGRVRWRMHALERLLERGISRTDVTSVIESGEIIESYSGDRPFPSVLVVATDPTPLHVVVALDRANQFAYVITAYKPDPDRFEHDTKTRRRAR